ncbi:MAG: hypothetical protein CFH37_00060 [Alphaproteobacteria bacterium MarineAlpha9_Bin7]|nr:MAG: hypothetical protein CFH37_00060 [Alphaproteobacteria bacterium MarineAlpha9_Bin7]
MGVVIHMDNMVNLCLRLNPWQASVVQCVMSVELSLRLA